MQRKGRNIRGGRGAHNKNTKKGKDGLHMGEKGRTPAGCAPCTAPKRPSVRPCPAGGRSGGGPPALLGRGRAVGCQSAHKREPDLVIHFIFYYQFSLLLSYIIYYYITP